MQTSLLPHDNLSDAIIAQIEEMIRNGDVEPGGWLAPQPELSRRFGVGLSTVREAIMGLALLGILLPQPGRGTQVSPEAMRLLRVLDLVRARVEAVDAPQIYEGRGILETELSRLAALRATDEDIAAIEEALAAMHAALDDERAYTQADLAYHVAVARAARSPLLEQFNHISWEILAQFTGDLFEIPGFKEQGIALQEAVLDAIRAHDPEAAALRAAAVVSYSGQILVTSLAVGTRKQSDAHTIGGATMETLLREMSEVLYKGDRARVAELVRQALDQGASPQQVLDDGLIASMDRVGKDFRDGILFVPEVLIAARAMKAGMEILRPLLAESGASPIGTVVIGTVKGDLHDIGKNLVAMMLEGAGFQVVDLGVDVAPERFVEAIQAHDASLVGLSALLTTTMVSMKDVVEALKEAGLKGQVKVLVGGAPVTADFATQVGADSYAPNASLAVEKARALIGQDAS